MWLANYPFCYMYIVRLRTPERAISLVLTEWLPLAIVLRVFYSANFWLTLLMLAGHFALYESGYLVNDLADSAAEPNGDHLEGRPINIQVFFSSRVALFCLITAVLWRLRGMHFALTYAILALLVLLGFLWHTSRRPLHLPFLRIFTFAFLYLYKTAPIIFPQVPLADAPWLLTSIFLCWGLWRFVFYILGKYGGERTSRGQDFDPLRLLHPMSLMLAAPLLLAARSHTARSEAAATLWMIYGSIALLRSGFQLSKWKLSPENWR